MFDDLLRHKQLFLCEDFSAEYSFAAQINYKRRMWLSPDNPY